MNEEINQPRYILTESEYNHWKAKKKKQLEIIRSEEKNMVIVISFITGFLIALFGLLILKLIFKG